MPITHTKTSRVLIVEDEVLIADTIKMNLERHGFSVPATVISYPEAISALQETQPDVVLLDIRLSGPRTGIDVANYLRSLPTAPPFIYLTSQMDEYHLELAKRTHPAAYLTKPIQINSLLATIKMVSYNASTFQQPGATVEIRHNGVTHVVKVEDICYLQAEHVYVRIGLTEDRTLLARGTFKDLRSKMNNDRFVQVHRSYVVNLDRVTGHDNTFLYFGRIQVPVSRSRRREVFARLLG